MTENELYHFGVKGMKWGVRRNRSSFVSTSGPKRLPGTYSSDGNGWTAKAKRLPGAIVKTSNGNVASAKVRMKNAKQAYKTADKAASKSFGEAYRYTDRHPIKSRIGKGKQKSNALWDDAFDKIDASNKAKASYKQSKKDYKAEKKAAANTPEAKARKEKLEKAAKVGAAVAGTALAAYGVYKVSKAISNKKQMQAAEAAVKKSLADKNALINTVNAAKKNTNFSNANRGAWTSGKHSYVYDKASGTEGYVSTEYLNFLRNQRK